MIHLLRVRGQSLSPRIEDGDFVLAVKLPIFFPIRVGDMIVFRKAPYGVLIKQVERLDEERRTFWVRGSHPESVDSRAFGAVQAGEIIGKVMAHFSKS
ncbi:MAG: S24/S26 family peptidase [Anaerolineales bacterium]|nr:S24/S26 family peptidase [Anaerolineales bacterium]